jgi:hypothetical protein
LLHIYDNNLVTEQKQIEHPSIQFGKNEGYLVTGEQNRQTEDIRKEMLMKRP